MSNIKYNEIKNRRAYYMAKSNPNPIMVEVNVLGEEGLNKVRVTTDFKETFLVLKWQLMDKEKYDQSKIDRFDSMGAIIKAEDKKENVTPYLNSMMSYVFKE